MMILKQEIIKYKNNTILKEQTDKKITYYSIADKKHPLYCGVVFTNLQSIKKYIDCVENQKEGVKND